ncbi:MAG: alanine racemase [Ferrovum sp. 37-45-19]|uniref:alanine racemase n=1 Tax=Ferrovum sp. JA12 TaxID=1356299 RepID=UPI000702C56F|nr:alanine racemase [Ferrovum sp. JA12]OYV80189.1 MAG: alanine racemase [Ferrovum sp. 21-44-67]OYV94466.1 MAG: alanine racemase [Ferrovum sp. 37-45-19]OZB32448.1 MAG: alanine racemase [Ferrovum sp. 34-44-207]HQT81636.1 alanine racemase [Ferrovaceae bacterium]KRH78869.1 alanine racemase [Ferrovum sp. JA12]
MTRPARITVHLNNIIHNTHVARKMHGGKILAVVKANAYGHGDRQVAAALAPHVEGFAVACLEEAIILREEGITQPIVLLEGPFSEQEVFEYNRYQLTPVIHHIDQWQWWSAVNSQKPIWLKLDTGMHRLGFNEFETIQLCSYKPNHPVPIVEVLMTHFANADSLNLGMVELPMQRFERVMQHFKVSSSVANSAAIMLHPQLRGHWARPGLMLYGVDPLGRVAEQVGLKPAMSFTSEVIALRWIEKGEAVGYGSLFTADKPTRVATIACGYADGYPRTAMHNAPVWINGEIVPLIGRVSMDMITVDVTHHHHVQVGSTVELWGERVSVADVARHGGTLAYELLCHTHRPSRYYD